MATIYTNPDADWSISKYNNDDTFGGCTSLIGSIPYDPSKTSGKYAKVKGGYFTAKGGSVPSSPDTEELSGKDSVLIISGGTDLYMIKGQFYTLPAKYSDGKVISWQSSDKNVAKVSGKNKVRAAKATDESIQSDSAIETSRKVRLYDKENTFAYIVHIADPYLADGNGKLTVSTKTMLSGESLPLSMQGFGSLEGKFKVSWQSSNSEVAAVENGTVTAFSKGSAKITAFVNGKSFAVNLKVVDVVNPGKLQADAAFTLSPLQTISLSFKDGFKVKNAVYEAADEETQELKLLEKKGKAYAYQNNVVRITTAGKLTAVGTGTARIKATANNGETRTFTVSVNEPVQKTVYLNAGKSRSLSHYNVKAGKAEWEVSEGKALIQALKNGKVTTNKNVSGTAIVICKYDPYKEEGVEGTGFTYTTLVGVENVEIQADSVVQTVKAGSSYKMTLSRGAEHELGIKGNIQPIVFESNKPLVAIADEDGRVYAREKGNATLTAKVNGKTIKIAVNVEQSSANNDQGDKVFTAERYFDPYDWIDDETFEETDAAPRLRSSSVEYDAEEGYGGQLTAQQKQVYDKLVDAYVDSYGRSRSGASIYEKLVFTPGDDSFVASSDDGLFDDIFRAYRAFVFDYPTVFWAG
ncbi:MAG: Ig-like domain-containing protein, partial [Lachnospiraceae bacterium]|nr:Ig-like domain-containing protein [Lachnospiraceae bacterium]